MSTHLHPWRFPTGESAVFTGRTSANFSANFSAKLSVKFSAIFFAILLAGLWLVPLAFAAEGGVDNPWMELLWKSVNFFVLMAILVFVARKPLQAMLRGGAGELKSTYDRTRSEAGAAEAELKTQQEKIANLQADLEKLLAEARTGAEQEKIRLTEEAREQAEKIKAQVQVQIEQEFKKASLELRKQLAAETVKLAEEMISRKMDKKQREQLVTETIEQLGASS